MLLAGCAGQRAYQEGNALLAQDQVAAGLAKYQEAVAADPGNAQYRSALLVARDKAATRLVLQAESAMAAGQGARAAGVGFVGGATSGGVLFSERDFWQMYPRGVDVRGMGGEAASATVRTWLASLRRQRRRRRR